MSDSVFMKIIRREIPADIVYEDDDAIVFKDHYPKAPTHLLVVPKKLIPSVADITEEDVPLMGHLLYVAKKVADDLGLLGYKLQFNVGKDGGQEVFHVHLHLMSKFSS